MQRRIITFTLALGIGLMFVSSAAMAQYQLTNLTSNQAGQAPNIDPMLVNGWGLAHTPTSPFWVSDQGSGWSTIYNAGGVKQGLVVAVPSATGSGPGQPTGLVFNGTTDFQVQGGSTPFIFSTLDGTIAAWAPSVSLTVATTVAKSPLSGAMYTGLAITSNPSGNFLFATDLANNKIDMYDTSFTLVNSFTDPTIPAGFGPFGIEDINGLLFVAFVDQAEGPGGVIDIYTENGVFLKRLTEGGVLNQPWGFAAAPPNFGPLSNTLLISNNINVNGTINAFNALTGQFVGTLKDTSGKNIRIDQLWGIKFGGGSANNGNKNELFFTAGPAGNLAGTFGAIVYKP
jgi:uncharacterized protein (TIGR03118 family)